MTKRRVQWRRIYEHQKRYATDILYEASTQRHPTSRDVEIIVKAAVNQIDIALWHQLDREIGPLW